jgi:MFS transporter, DHA1 family, inner membrane transport protein
MAYFHNRTVNLLNLHYLIGSVATGGGGAFYAVYLLKAGLSVPATLAALAVTLATRLILRSFLLPIGIRLGLRRLVILGSLLVGASYPFLAGVHGIGFGLGVLIFTSALADTVYWPSYHAYFAALGDEDHRGQQLGVREGIAAALGIVSPLAAGWLLLRFGPAVAFGATGVVQALSAIPIAFTPDVPIARHAPGAFRAALRGAMLFAGDGWVAGGYFITWQIALFVTLGEDYLAYGGALAVAALAGGVGGLFLGRLIDSGKGTRAVWLSVGTLCFVIALRINVLHHPALAVFANALGALVSCLYVPTLMTAVYNQAKRSPCVLRFHIAAEGGWDIGVTAALGLAALITWLGLSIAYGIALAFVGAAIVFVLARRYYRDHPAERIESHEPPEFAAQPAKAPKI